MSSDVAGVIFRDNDILGVPGIRGYICVYLVDEGKDFFFLHFQINLCKLRNNVASNGDMTDFVVVFEKSCICENNNSLIIKRYTHDKFFKC